MSYDPTPTQALLLFRLLARQGACAQAELKTKVQVADREGLVKAKMITAPKVGRGFKLKLEDAGLGLDRDTPYRGAAAGAAGALRLSSSAQ